jgi:hypothetical protein
MLAVAAATYSAKKEILVWNIYRLAAGCAGEARTACLQKIQPPS